MKVTSPIRWRRYRSFKFTGTQVACNLCGADEVSVVARRDRWLQSLTNVMCQRCGLVYLQPMPDNNELDEFYRHHFWQRSQGTTDPTPKQIWRSFRSAEGRLAILAPVLKPGARILDVGAGGGEFVTVAQRHGFMAEGIEPSANYVSYAQRVYKVTIHGGTLTEVDIGDRRFDVITCSHALEHMRDPLGALKKLHELLEPAGHAFIWVPDLIEPGRWPYRNFHPGHLHGFTHETLVMMAAKAGFEVPDDGPKSTCLLLRRGSGPDPNWFRFPGHAERLKARLKRQTVWRYLCSAQSWRRIPSRIAYWFMAHVMARHMTNI